MSRDRRLAGIFSEQMGTRRWQGPCRRGGSGNPSWLWSVKWWWDTDLNVLALPSTAWEVTATTPLTEQERFSQTAGCSAAVAPTLDSNCGCGGVAEKLTVMECQLLLILGRGEGDREGSGYCLVLQKGAFRSTLYFYYTFRANTIKIKIKKNKTDANPPWWKCILNFKSYMNNHDRMRFNFLKIRGKKTCIDAPAR